MKRMGAKNPSDEQTGQKPRSARARAAGRGGASSGDQETYKEAAQLQLFNVWGVTIQACFTTFHSSKTAWDTEDTKDSLSLRRGQLPPWVKILFICPGMKDNV